jgi:hypothetical protein
MKPGGWFDALLFAGGSFVPAAGATWWSAREAHSHTDQIHLMEAVNIAGLALLFGAGVYKAAQERRQRADVLYPRRAGAVISVSLGVAYPLLVAGGGWALHAVLGEQGVGPGLVALLCLLPWVLSRAQWTTLPLGSE